jgi:hypothetical protein
MGLLSSIAQFALPAVGNLIAPGIGGAIGGGLAGMLGSRDTPSSMTATNTQKIDPRMDAMLWGKDGSNGLLGQYQSYLNQPQSAALQNYGKTAGDYLTNFGAGNQQQLQGAATGLIGGNSAALASLPAYAVGNQVKAPGQNNIDLTGSYQNLLGGGNTAALNKSLQSAVDLTNASFQKNQTDLTNNLTRNVLPQIRGGAIAAGQYGSSRQGIAEGNALSDYTNQLTNANTTLGLANSANTTAQQAQAYQQGQDRALAATQGLGAQQYGAASQNANTANQAEFMNVGNSFDASKFNAGTVNAVNAQNNSAALGGAGLLSGLTNQAYGVATNADNYGINRATQVNGLLAPYLGANSSSSSTQPVFQNTGSNVLGGALLGGQLSGLLGGMRGGTSTFNVPSSVDNMAATIGNQQLSIPSLPNLWS